MKIPNFLKKKNINKETINEENKNKVEVIDGVEVLDFEEKTTTKSALEEKKETRTIIIILIIILLFAFALPKVTSWFKKSSIFSYTDTVNDVIEDKTVDGMLVIGKEEGSITAKGIQFYNFKKRQNSEISVVYLPKSTIKDVDKYNIYIELYNSKKSIIYRVKFTSDSKLERKVQGSYNFKVLEDTYKDAKYAKVLIIKANDWGKGANTLACKKEETKDGYKLIEKVTYNFSDLGLLNYKVSKKIEELPVEEGKEQKPNPYTKILESESKMMDKTNVTDLLYDDESIEYSVDLANLEIGKSNYTPLHSHGSILKSVRLEETYNGWVCE